MTTQSYTAASLDGFIAIDDDSLDRLSPLGDLRPLHDEMRRAAGRRNLRVVGGGDLAGRVHDAGRLDEVIVQVGSVTLGRGRPPFPRRLTTAPLQLLSARQVCTGFAELRHAGAAGGPLSSPCLPR